LLKWFLLRDLESELDEDALFELLKVHEKVVDVAINTLKEHVKTLQDLNVIVAKLLVELLESLWLCESRRAFLSFLSVFEKGWGKRRRRRTHGIRFDALLVKLAPVEIAKVKEDERIAPLLKGGGRLGLCRGRMDLLEEEWWDVLAQTQQLCDDCVSTTDEAQKRLASDVLLGQKVHLSRSRTGAALLSLL